MGNKQVREVVEEYIATENFDKHLAKKIGQYFGQTMRSYSAEEVRLQLAKVGGDPDNPRRNEEFILQRLGPKYEVRTYSFLYLDMVRACTIFQRITQNVQEQVREQFFEEVCCKVRSKFARPEEVVLPYIGSGGKRASVHNRPDSPVVIFIRHGSVMLKMKGSDDGDAANGRRRGSVVSNARRRNNASQNLANLGTGSTIETDTIFRDWLYVNNMVVKVGVDKFGKEQCESRTRMRVVALQACCYGQLTQKEFRALLKKFPNIQRSYDICVEKEIDAAAEDAKLKALAARRDQEQILCNAVGRGDIEAVKSAVRQQQTPISLTIGPERATPLHLACCFTRPKVLAKLLSLGANVSSTDSLGRTPMHTACEVGWKEGVYMLGDAGASLEVVDNVGATPLHLAAASGSLFVLHALVSIAEKRGQVLPINAKTEDGLTAIDLCPTWRASRLLKPKGMRGYPKNYNPKGNLKNGVSTKNVPPPTLPPRIATTTTATAVPQSQPLHPPALPPKSSSSSSQTVVHTNSTGKKKKKKKRKKDRVSRVVLNRIRSDAGVQKFVRGFAAKHGPAPSKQNVLEFEGTEYSLNPIAEGQIGGVYALSMGPQKPPVGVFKPCKEEVKDEKGFLSIGSVHPHRKGFVVGSGAVNEVIAYVLDLSAALVSNMKPFVPMTMLVKGIGSSGEECIKGSIQEFVPNECSSEDIGPNTFSCEEVHRVGLLDLWLMNCDRHPGNLLFQNSQKRLPNLIPIDHGLVLPPITELSEAEFCWSSWKQTKLPFSEDCRSWVLSLGTAVNRALPLLVDLGIRKESLLTLRATTLLLQKCVSEGMTLRELSLIWQRYGSQLEKPAVLEQLITYCIDDCSSSKKVLVPTSSTSIISEKYDNFTAKLSAAIDVFLLFWRQQKKKLKDGDFLGRLQLSNVLYENQSEKWSRVAPVETTSEKWNEIADTVANARSRNSSSIYLEKEEQGKEKLKQFAVAPHNDNFCWLKQIVYGKNNLFGIMYVNSPGLATT
eukprot:g3095.t1